VAPARPLALVGSVASLLRAVGQHLHTSDTPPPLTCSLDEVRALLGPDSDGLLVLVAAGPEDAEAIYALVQEIQLEKWPVRLLLLETEDAGGRLADLDPYVSGRLTWPDHGRGLLTWVRRHGEKAGGFRQPATSERAEIAGRLLGPTPSLAPLVDALALAAVHPVTVLIDGETGTGKTFLARLIHDCSPRKRQRFVVVPCGALAANLVESEFFGHVKGAFTGADGAKAGKFAAAGQGTVLLDEIDALGLEQQANLLRVIETGEYEPVGSNETHHCQARFIVATNWNLEEAVARGQFRRDLYYRLNVLSFYLPPLRERVADIAPLARGLVAHFAARFHKGLFAIAPDVFAALESFAWPGNIRQLENVLQQAVLVSDGPQLRLQHLPPLVAPSAPVRGDTRPTLARNREAHERAAIQRALDEANQSRTRAAQALGVSRVTLYKKMKKYGFLDPSGRAALA
jgi:transcriptional regulator with PAS, ATPase and Fis domain